VTEALRGRERADLDNLKQEETVINETPLRTVPTALTRLSMRIPTISSFAAEENELSAGWTARAPRYVLAPWYFDPWDSHTTQGVAVVIAGDPVDLTKIALHHGRAVSQQSSMMAASSAGCVSYERCPASRSITVAPPMAEIIRSASAGGITLSRNART
jgi:hypothetical protein